MRRWKKTSQTRDPQIEQELLRDIRALLYVLALQGRDGLDSFAMKRLDALEKERMEDAPE